MKDSLQDQLQVVLEKSSRRVENKISKSPKPGNHDLDGFGQDAINGAKEADYYFNGKKLFQGTYAYIETRKRCTSSRP